MISANNQLPATAARPTASSSSARPGSAADRPGAGDFSGAAEFAQVLRDAQQGAATRTAEETRRKAGDAASKFVADLFVMPLLSEMRKFPFGRRFGDGGRGEEVFGEQLDQHYADIAAGGGFRRLTDMIAQRMEQFGTSDRRERAADWRPAEIARPTVG